MKELVLVRFAGAVGTGAHFALSTGIGILLDPQFPYGTVFVNVLASFLISAIAYALTAAAAIRRVRQRSARR